MKTKSFFISMVGMLVSFFLMGTTYSQTAGNFTFTLTTTSSGGYSPKNLVAIWVENNSGAFVKTKVKYSSVSNYDHLAIWTGKSYLDLTDATTGATRNTHGTLTVVWNGTDVSGNLVPDGTYNVWIEMAWAASLTTGKTSTSFSFTKGPGSFHSTPANTTNFTGITLDWAPGTTYTQAINNTELCIYPNPAEKFIKLSFQKPVSNSNIQILDVLGKEVYAETITSAINERNIDISGYTAGVYFINFSDNGKNTTYRIVKK